MNHTSIVHAELADTHRLEQAAAVALRDASQVAARLAAAAADDRYDQVAALAAAGISAEARGLLPLPEADPSNTPPDEDDPAAVHQLAARLESGACELDALGRAVGDRQAVHNHHVAAVMMRDTAAALLRALLPEATAP